VIHFVVTSISQLVWCSFVIKLHPKQECFYDSCISFSVGKHVADLSWFNSFFKSSGKKIKSDLKSNLGLLNRIFIVHVESVNVLLGFAHHWRLHSVTWRRYRPQAQSVSANRRVRVTAWGFLLVFYSNRRPKTHRFELGVWDRQTDGRMDGSQHRVMPSMERGRRCRVSFPQHCFVYKLGYCGPCRYWVVNYLWYCMCDDASLARYTVVVYWHHRLLCFAR